MNKKKETAPKRSNLGRIPKKDPATNNYMVRLNSEDNARVLTFFEQSVMHTKAHFILAKIFNKEFKMISVLCKYFANTDISVPLYNK